MKVRRKFILINSRVETAHCSIVPNNKEKSAYDTFPLQPETRHVLGRHSRVNLTGLLRRLQVKIEYIYLFNLILKTWRRL